MLQMQSIANKRSKMVCPGYAQSLGNSTVGANKRSKMGALGPSPDNLRGCPCRTRDNGGCCELINLRGRAWQTVQNHVLLMAILAHELHQTTHYIQGTATLQIFSTHHPIAWGATRSSRHTIESVLGWGTPACRAQWPGILRSQVHHEPMLVSTMSIGPRRHRMLLESRRYPNVHRLLPSCICVAFPSNTAS